MERNELPVPVFGQNYTWYCGFAAIQMVMAYHSEFMSQERIATLFSDKNVLDVKDYLDQKRDQKGKPLHRWSKIEGQHGIFCADMTRFLRKHGFTVRNRYDASIEDLCKSIDNDAPVIVWTKPYTTPDDDTDTHFIVMTGYTPTSILVNDPYNLERCRITREKFERLRLFSDGFGYTMCVAR